MTNANSSPTSVNYTDSAETPNPVVQVLQLHRLREIRLREGISQRTVARRSGVSINDVRLQEHLSTDIPISVLHQWQAVLDVPLAELLVEPDEHLSPPLARRAQLVRVMKTAQSITEQTTETSVKRLAQTLIDQLVQIMPELQSVGPWHAVGQRRRRDELGRVAEYVLPEDMFIERGE